MRKNISKKFILFLITILITLFIPQYSKAVLQANKPDENNVTLRAGSNNKQGVEEVKFFNAIRQMESINGTLGKESDIDLNTGVDRISGGNGIDCHMIREVEWGTIALLSASTYGEAPVNTSDSSTTGNNSGVFQMANTIGEFTTYNTNRSLGIVI